MSLKPFTVKVTETLIKYVDIEATSKEEAEDISRQKYYDNEIELDYTDYCKTTFVVNKRRIWWIL